jgi:hypothetical protein
MIHVEGRENEPALQALSPRHGTHVSTLHLLSPRSTPLTRSLYAFTYPKFHFFHGSQRRFKVIKLHESEGRAVVTSRGDNLDF